MTTFATLPSEIITIISDILSQQNSSEWIQHAVSLHEQYATREKFHRRIALKEYDDLLAYLAMRVPATYAQIYSVFSTIKELLPLWQPKNILDLGCGPGTGSWAAQQIWPSLIESTSVDQHDDFFSLGEKIQNSLNENITITWQKSDLSKKIMLEENKYDIVLLANVLNEINPSLIDKIIGQAFNNCRGMLVIIEPGTPFGSSIIQNAARKLSKAGILLAPYINSTFTSDDEYYLHFPQRFIRPNFQRRIRQYMRDSSLMASDWEETKYSYTVISKIIPKTNPWGKCVGPIRLQKGFLEVPILTQVGIEKIKVMKRHSEQYFYVKNLKWGEYIERKELVEVALPSKP